MIRERTNWTRGGWPKVKAVNGFSGRVVWRDAERGGSNLDFEIRQSLMDRRYRPGQSFPGNPQVL